MTIYKFELFADYFQLYLLDDDSESDTSDIWTETALDLKLALADKTLAVGTLRNVDVKFEVEVLEEKPSLDMSEWDHASLGNITISSGKCVVMGCTDYLPEAERISIPAGNYSALSLAKGLDSIENKWDDADDLYKVVLWPSNDSPYELVKRYEIA